MVKKWMYGFAVGMMALALAGCGSRQTGNGAAQTTAETVQTEETMERETAAGAAAWESAEPERNTDAVESTDAAENTEAGENFAEENTGSGKDVLIAYFSWSGNTEKLAEMIAEETGGTLFRIEPAEPYTEDYNALLDQAQEEQASGARPALAADVENWEDFDIVFIGYPNWWSDVPMLVNTFMEAHDFNGKTVIPFCTHGSGGFGRSLSSIEAGTAGATVLEGFETAGSGVDGAQSRVAEWISSLGLFQ